MRRASAHTFAHRRGFSATAQSNFHGVRSVGKPEPDMLNPCRVFCFSHHQPKQPAHENMNKLSSQAAANDRMALRRAASCVHFTGFAPGSKCRANVAYDSFKCGRSLPCLPPFKDGDARDTCPHFVAKGIEAVRREDAEDDAFSAKINRVRAAIVAHSKTPDGKNRECECPVCGGRVRYSIAQCNGHISVGCRTPGCVRWVE